MYLSTIYVYYANATLVYAIILTIVETVLSIISYLESSPSFCHNLFYLISAYRAILDPLIHTWLFKSVEVLLLGWLH